MEFSRRRFVQLLASASTQSGTIAKWSLSAIGAGLLGACRSIQRVLSPPSRWVIPTTVGDFEIDTRTDLRKIRSFPLLLWAYRIQFPSVAATMVEPESAMPLHDSEQALLHGVWVVIDAEPKTELFREHDIVRTGVLRSGGASGDFSLSVDPQFLFPRLGPAVPLSLVFPGHDRKRVPERDKLLRFDFCVRPDMCASNGDRSTLPVVTAIWPKYDVILRTHTGDVRLRTKEHRPIRAALEACELHAAPAIPELRWVAADVPFPPSLRLHVWTHPDSSETTFEYTGTGTPELRIRPGFIDLKFPAGAFVEHNGRRSELAESHLHSANLYAQAWQSEMEVDPTPLPLEVASRFCLDPAHTADPWVFAPDPLHVPRLGTAIAVNAAMQDVDASRVSTRLRRGEITHDLEQQFGKVTLTFRSSRPLAPSIAVTAGQTPIDVSLSNGQGRFVAEKAIMRSPMFVLVEDLFAQPDGDEAEIRFEFREQNRRYEVLPESSATFSATRFAWAGRYERDRDKNELHATSWVHLLKGGAVVGDQRADAFTLTQPATIRWRVGTGGFGVTVDPSAAASANEVVALADTTFRAAAPDTFPRDPNKEPVYFPSFALREHRDLPATFVTGTGAFSAKDMWEPRSETHFRGATDSPTDLFRAVAAADARSDLRAFYAGFGMRGSVGPLSSVGWAPDVERCTFPGLAPYRGIRGDELQPVKNAVDVLEPSSVYAPCVEPGFRDHGQTIQARFRNDETELAISPIGGTVRFGWTTEKPSLGLNELVLRGFLGRYQKNYAIFADLLLPYGLKINVLTLTARQDNGHLRYCTKWWFAEEFKEYGDSANIVLRNLRPLNAVNFDESAPMLFQADVHYRSGDDVWVDFDRTFQGIGLQRAATDPAAAPLLDQTAVLQKPQPLTLFTDTPMRLSRVRWRAESATGGALPDCTTVPTGSCPRSVLISVTASGELEHVEGMHFDTRDIAVSSRGEMSADTADWCDKATKKRDEDPVYGTNALTLGDGVVRVNRPFVFHDRFRITAKKEHRFEKKIKARDLGLLQLIPGGEGEFLDNEGTLTIVTRIDVQHVSIDQGASKEDTARADVEAIVDFPEFTKGVKEICGENLNFRIAVTPKSFRASFKQSLSDTNYDAKLIADVGVPGLLRLKDCTIQSRPGQAVEFKPGNLDICGELLRMVLEFLMEKLKGMLGFDKPDGGGGKSPFTFEFLDGLKGFLVKLRLPMPDIPLGAGTLKRFTFDLRIGVSIDISAEGFNAGAMMTFILGDYRLPGFGGIPWLKLDLPTVARRIFSRMHPPTLIVTPFTVRFSVVGAMRVSLPRNVTLKTLDGVCFSTVMCISGEGGLAAAFDVGIASGEVSITLGIVWCPHATFKVGLENLVPKADKYFSFDEIAVVARIDAHACVVGIINISIRVEMMTVLKLTCPEGILGHMEISGSASIEIGFVTIDYHFTVNLDPILGIDPNACAQDKPPGVRDCARLDDPELQRLVRMTTSDFFFAPAEVAA